MNLPGINTGGGGLSSSSSTGPLTTSASFDNSGWTVSTGSSKASSSPAGAIPWTMIAIAAVAAVALWRIK